MLFCNSKFRSYDTSTISGLLSAIMKAITIVLKMK